MKMRTRKPVASFFHNTIRLLLTTVFASVWLSGTNAHRVGDRPGHGLFEYHSGFWVNLHHFLYEEASSEAAAEKPRRIEPEVPSDKAVVASLTPEERKHWSASVAYYKSKMIDHDLLMEPDMIRLKDHLEDVENESALHADQLLDADLVAALEQAAPVYRAHWWPQQDNENRAWIAAVSPLVEQYGARLSQEIATAYDTQWSNEVIRVDVCAYANWAGAYTSLFPTRVTISSADPANQGLAALESVFHEASHGLIDNVQNAISRESEARKLTLPDPRLWHAVLFFTAGYYVQQVQPDYTPYADKIGLWARGAWTAYRAPLRKDWQPHLEGKTSLQAAIAQLVADLGKPVSP